MKKALRIFSVLVITLAVFSSCRKGGRIIPRDRMSKMYAEMLLTDQWISTHYDMRRHADTTFVYGPVLEKYGYTAEDWRASVAEYLHDPQRYARMLHRTVEILEKRVDELEALNRKDAAAAEYLQGLERFRPKRIFTMSGMKNREVFVEGGVVYFVDTLGGDWMFDPDKDADTVYKGPMLIWPVPSDTTALADSLAVADSLATADSLAAADSLSVEGTANAADSLAAADTVRKAQRISFEEFKGIRIKERL